VRVFVTGASGFVGQPACRELLRRGHEVHALVRRRGSEPEGTIPIAGDLSDRSALRRGIAGCDAEAVLHLAAETAATKDQAAIARANIVGTRNVLGACADVGAARFVFASTVVTGEAGGAILTEESELPVQTGYGLSKQEGERLVLASELPYAIVRPSHVYGPGGWYAHEVVRRLRGRGRLAVVGKGDNWWDVLHVDDLASALALAVEHTAPARVFHVVDDEPIRCYDFVALTAQALGVGPPRRVPAWVAKLSAGSEPVSAVTRSARSSNARAKAELGWVLRFPTAEVGVPDAVAQLAAA
jgi:nucleoside-diphosphate-sugar epimerase